MIAAKGTPWGILLSVATIAVFGFNWADFLGLLKSHNFLSGCGSIAAAVAVVINWWNNRDQRQLHRLESLVRSNEATIENQDTTIRSLEETVESLKTSQIAHEAELAQVSEELLRRDDYLAVHSGDRQPIRPAVPAVSSEVLVVDDDAWVCQSMTRVLSRYGFRVESARSYAGARACVDHRNQTGRRYDFAIVDLKLPDCEIDDMLRLVAEIVPGTDVIIATGLGSDEILARARVHATRVLVKPIELKELLALMDCET